MAAAISTPARAVAESPNSVACSSKPSAAVIVVLCMYAANVDFAFPKLRLNDVCRVQHRKSQLSLHHQVPRRAALAACAHSSWPAKQRAVGHLIRLRLALPAKPNLPFRCACTCEPAGLAYTHRD